MLAFVVAREMNTDFDPIFISAKIVSLKPNQGCVKVIRLRENVMTYHPYMVGGNMLYCLKSPTGALLLSGPVERLRGAVCSPEAWCCAQQ